jgi:hypothetical protein
MTKFVAAKMLYPIKKQIINTNFFTQFTTQKQSSWVNGIKKRLSYKTTIFCTFSSFQYLYISENKNI